LAGGAAGHRCVCQCTAGDRIGTIGTWRSRMVARWRRRGL